MSVVAKQTLPLYYYASEPGCFGLCGFFVPGVPLFFAISKLRPEFDPLPRLGECHQPAATSNSPIVKQTVCIPKGLLTIGALPEHFLSGKFEMLS